MKNDTQSKRKQKHKSIHNSETAYINSEMECEKHLTKAIT